ncbi:putative PP2C [Cardiosporidium cionae]|uniref:PP2C n=1 Tax=Cardiosporidium cionae TaxID=476202 RepID=A0ABQ7JF37_9APIC|nr:putative PP2C [Cardiosporidium cionae]|eukprot:KAF8822622.1 putative PP2C [Cardiosporidium cionae]
MGGCRSKAIRRVETGEPLPDNLSVPVTPAETTPFVSAAGSSPRPGEGNERYDNIYFDKIHDVSYGIDEDMHSIQASSNVMPVTIFSSSESLLLLDPSYRAGERRRLSVSTVNVSPIIAIHASSDVESPEALSSALEYSLPPAADLPEVELADSNEFQNDEESQLSEVENQGSSESEKKGYSSRRKRGSPLFTARGSPQDLSVTIPNENDEPEEISEMSFIGFMPKSSFQFIALGLPSDDKKQESFTEKRCKVIGNYPRDVLREYGFGYSCRKGLKPESPNQDDFCILRTENWGLYGVFDGHGPHGHLISSFVHHLLPFALLSNLKQGMEIKSAFHATFARVQQQLEDYCTVVDPDLDLNMSGTTATVILHSDSKLYIAHVGDSRAVLGQANGLFRELTCDHKPILEVERKRIEASGGEVRQLEGDIPYRVFLKGLAMSRAFGDILGTTVGVISEPEISEFTLTPSDLFFILSSDGVWEFISSEEAVEIVAKKPRDQAQKAVEVLASESWKRWIAEEGNVVDDVSYST